VAKLVGGPGTTTCIRQACHGKPEKLLLKNKYLILGTQILMLYGLVIRSTFAKYYKWNYE
jgi:hypothetical protein